MSDSSSSAIQELSARLDAIENDSRRLKRENKRWRSAFIVFACAGLLAASAGFQSRAITKVPKVVEAESFVLRDEKGKVRAKLWMYSPGNAELMLQDSSENVRLSVSVRKTGSPQVVLFDPGEKVRARIAVEPDGDVSDFIYGKKEDGFVGSRITTEGHVALIGGRGNTDPRFGLQVEAGGNTRFRLQRDKAVLGAEVVVYSTGEVSQDLYDTKGMRRATCGIRDDGSADLLLFSAKKGQSVSIRAEAGGALSQTLLSNDAKDATFLIIDERGKPLAGVRRNGRTEEFARVAR